MGTENRYKQKKDCEKLQDVKRMMCRKLIMAIRQERQGPITIAARLGTSRAVVSRIENERVDQLTFNQLFFYLVILRPGFQIMISLGQYT